MLAGFHAGRLSCWPAFMLAGAFGWAVNDSINMPHRWMRSWSAAADTAVGQIVGITVTIGRVISSRDGKCEERVTFRHIARIGEPGF